MDTSGRDDAIALWGDVIDLMAADESTPAQISAMVASAVPVDFDGEAITIEASAKFMKNQLEKNAAAIERCLAQAAFSPVSLHVTLAGQPAGMRIDTSSVVSAEELESMPQGVSSSEEPTPAEPAKQAAPDAAPGVTARREETSIEERRLANPLVTNVTENDSKLTFDRFVVGEENMIALQAAKQVADGFDKYNPLFIYGRSGLGKTHLLKAIQNYIIQNDIEKLCVYRTAHEFVTEYVEAMVDTDAEVKRAFTRHYQDVDILIIDDVQYLKGPASVGFFFDLFNYLRDHGKQVVLAADESPVQLGISNEDFEERLISRMNSGFACPVQAPEYELKLALVRNFYTRAKEDAAAEHIPGYEGTITDETLQLMAERSGSNIRVIESFCQACLLEATKLERSGRALGREDVARLSAEKFGSTRRTVTIDQIQRAVEEEFSVSHAYLISSSRRKEVKTARHVGCWLARNLTTLTLAETGERFGGRSHATVSHSVDEVEKLMKEDSQILDRITRLKDILLNG